MNAVYSPMMVHCAEYHVYAMTLLEEVLNLRKSTCFREIIGEPQGATDVRKLLPGRCDPNPDTKITAESSPRFVYTACSDCM